MPASPIRKLAPFARRAEEAGKKIYYLNIGQPDIPTPKLMLEAVKKTEIDILAYSPSEGFDSYRQKLVTYYEQAGVKLQQDDIMVTTGGSEALFFGMFSCLDSGDEVIIPEPFYANYNGFAKAGNVKVKPIVSTIENGFALPPASAFEQMISPATKAILLCNPSNPTGYLYSREELEALGAIALKYDLFLFVDEVYREFCYDGQEHHSILSIPGLEEHAIVVDSISKRYSACGARIGALVCKNKTVMAAALKFAQARLSPPTLAQILAEASSDVPATYFNEVKEEYTARRDLVVDRLNNMEGVQCPTPGGAFYCFVRLPVADVEHFCQWMLEEFDDNGETVMMAPGTGFYATHGMGFNEVRIAYILNREGLSRALDILEKGLTEYERLGLAEGAGLQTMDGNT